MLHLPATRYQAFAFHLALSAFVFLLLATTLYFFWFPHAFIFMGGLEGFRLLAGVDLVLGPVLTLIVYNRAKKTIKFDLAVIGIIQFACLAAGVWVVNEQRPLAQILVNDRIEVFTRSDLSMRKIDMAAIKEIEGGYPKAIYIDLPEDPIARKITLATSFLNGPLEAREDLYRPLKAMNKDVLKTKDYSSDKACYWLPIRSEYYQGEACLSLVDGVVDLRS